MLETDTHILSSQDDSCPIILRYRDLLVISSTSSTHSFIHSLQLIFMKNLHIVVKGSKWIWRARDAETMQEMTWTFFRVEMTLNGVILSYRATIAAVLGPSCIGAYLGWLSDVNPRRSTRRLPLFIPDSSFFTKNLYGRMYSEQPKQIIFRNRNTKVF